MTKLLQSILRINLLWLGFTTVIAAPNADTPIEITADKAKYDHAQGIATYSGRVTMQQGTRNLHANNLQIYRDANNKINLMVATGEPARFESQANEPKAGRGEAEIIRYYPQTQKVDLYNNAKLTQNDDTVTAPKLTYNFVTEELQGESDPQKRTTVILQPKRAS